MFCGRERFGEMDGIQKKEAGEESVDITGCPLGYSGKRR